MSTLGEQLTNIDAYDPDGDGDEPITVSCPECGCAMRLTLTGGHYECPNQACQQHGEWFDWDGETLSVVPPAF